jgi:endonuclease/exonuclease/phosphatase (EEP) superfamily protein YafD
VLVKHSPDFEPLVGTPKSATFVKYPVSGKEHELLVVSVHGINFETNGAFKRQMRQLKTEIEKHEGPVLLAGDFNTWNHSRSSHLSSLISRLGLVEASYKNGEARLSFAGHFLDHIYTRGVVVNNALVVAESIGSDHKPFLLDFSIP